MISQIEIRTTSKCAYIRIYREAAADGEEWAIEQLKITSETSPDTPANLHRRQNDAFSGVCVGVGVCACACECLCGCRCRCVCVCVCVRAFCLGVYAYMYEYS